MNTQLANLALMNFGQYEVTDIDTDNSVQAKAVRAAWDLVRDDVMGSANWLFALKIATLTKLTTTPTGSRWGWHFTLPTDFLRVVWCNGRAAGLDDCPAFSIMGVHLVSNEETAVLEYVAKIEDTDLWDASFREMFSYALAEKIVPALSLSPDLAKAMASQKEAAALRALTRGAVQRQPIVKRSLLAS